MSQNFCFDWMTAVVSWMPPVHQYFTPFKRTHTIHRDRDFTFLKHLTAYKCSAAFIYKY